MNIACPIQASGCVTVSVDVTKIDRIDDRGNITSHYTRDGLRTICGLCLRGRSQRWLNNGFCRRCEKIAARCQNNARAASDVKTEGGDEHEEAQG